LKTASVHSKVLQNCRKRKKVFAVLFLEWKKEFLN